MIQFNVKLLIWAVILLGATACTTTSLQNFRSSSHEPKTTTQSSSVTANTNIKKHAKVPFPLSEFSDYQNSLDISPGDQDDSLSAKDDESDFDGNQGDGENDPLLPLEEELAQESDNLNIAIDPSAYDFPEMEQNARVKSLLNFYLNRRRDLLESDMQAAAKLMPTVQRILKEEDLPQDLAYLAAIESNYKLQARSHKNALGLWQFIPETGRQFKLKQNRWVDERMDPIKSTRAAAKFLKSLHRKFGSWTLALSAYNCGEGRVQKAIDRAKAEGKEGDYWSLQLPKETLNYVPAYMAMTIIAKNRKKFGLNEIEQQTSIYEDSVTVSTDFSLQEIAQRSKTSLTEFLSFNPFYLQTVPPLNQKTYSFFLPLTLKRNFLKSLEIQPLPRKEWKVAQVMSDHSDKMTQLLMNFGESKQITVKKGDNLAKIARRNEITPARLRTWNNLNEESKLSSKQKLLVYLPTWQVFTKLEDAHIGNDTTVVSLQNEAGKIIAESKTQKKYAANSSELNKSATLKSNPKVNLTEMKVSKKSASQKIQKIFVKKGETLQVIARRYSVSVAQLISFNDLKSNQPLYHHQVLFVPPSNG